MIFFIGSDFAFGYTSLTGTYATGGWTETGWNIAMLFFALAALRQMYQRPASALTRRWMATMYRLPQWLPIIAVALAYGLVSYVVIVNDSRAAEWLLTGALLRTFRRQPADRLPRFC